MIIINTLLHVLAPTALSSRKTCSMFKNCNSFVHRKVAYPEDNTIDAKTCCRLLTFLLTPFGTNLLEKLTVS